jgi:hypothetical protein
VNCAKWVFESTSSFTRKEEGKLSSTEHDQGWSYFLGRCKNIVRKRNKTTASLFLVRAIMKILENIVEDEEVLRYSITNEPHHLIKEIKAEAITTQPHIHNQLLKSKKLGRPASIVTRLVHQRFDNMGIDSFPASCLKYSVSHFKNLLKHS